jgi:aminoglycoside phosphotransferase (APT) family kinase protein
VQLDSAATAERVEHILRRLGDRHFPQILARLGSALLIRWVDHGSSANHLLPDTLRRCALVHGWIHTVEAAHLSGGGANGTELWRERLEAASEQLEQQGGRFGTDARRLLAVAREHTPAMAATGVIHGDFCADNIVVQSPERLFVIDNETVQIGPLDYDLARTWYRWPMRRAEWKSYLDAYAEQRSPAQFETHFNYWAVLVLIDSARWHLTLGTGGACIPLRRLRALARRIEGSGAGVGEWR